MRFALANAWKSQSPRMSDRYQLVTGGMTHYEAMLNGIHVRQLMQGFESYLKELDQTLAREEKTIPKHARKKWGDEIRAPFERRKAENANLRGLVDFVLLEIDNGVDELGRLQNLMAEFRASLASASNEQKKRRLILDVAQALGATSKQLKGDEKAFHRWFSEEAIVDRHVRRRGETEQRLSFHLERLGHLLRRVTRLTTDPGGVVSLWERLRLEQKLNKVFSYEGDARVAVAGMRCLRMILEVTEPSIIPELIGHKTHHFVLRAASESELDVWLQSEALAVLAMIEPSEFEIIVTQRLTQPGSGDDLFVRGRAIDLVIVHLANHASLPSVTECGRRDPSPFVRQQWARRAWDLPPELSCQRIEEFWHDEHPQVRAAAVAIAADFAADETRQTLTLRLFTEALATEKNEFVMRTLLHASSLWLERYVDQLDTADGDLKDPSRTDEVLETYQREIMPQVRALISADNSVLLQRWSAAAVEKMRCLCDPGSRKLLRRLRAIASKTPIGKSSTIPASITAQIPELQIGRTLAVLTQTDFGCDLEKGLFRYRLVRGPVFRFRLWRAVFEFFAPATDKRQAFLHTVGRVSRARLRAPSRITGELSETKVPGEPLVMATEGSYRPFLPLLDDFVSILNLSWLWPATVKFFSSEGVTEVSGPKLPWTKLRAAWHLTFRFQSIAALRNYDDQSKADPASYLKKMSKLGFRIRFYTYDSSERSERMEGAGEVPPRPPVTVFFPCLMAFWTPEFVHYLWHYVLEYAAYFNSTYDSTLAHLTIFAVAAFFLFAMKHAWANIGFAAARRRIPLSIGGWGTRGKSGTERLKAALLGAMGHGLVSKTTGCEAMFIQGHAFGEPLEIPLFRPYDKATIWEQKDIFVLASKLGPSVFLWECMGLTPSYVDILQRQWSRDDLGTITNTYPDHEDLQGPAGYNVADTICTFIPRKAHLLTTEQQMLPLINERCKSAHTSLEGVGWLESGLITDDILDRFPYKEHPDNIALVAAMAVHLGCEYDYALKAQADYLVPDLGVLKTYPVARIRHREIEFTNGMSANERFGCLGNWQRMGYAAQDPYAEPNVWISTVVNNRADRVARSRAFASILVKDVSADRHFMIGGNLKGLNGFIWEAWEEHVGSYSIVPADGAFDPVKASDTILKFAKQFRQAIDSEHIQNRLRVMLRAVDDNGQLNIDQLVSRWQSPEEVASALQDAMPPELAGAIRQHHESMLTSLKEYEALQQACMSASDSGKLQNMLHQTLKQWFARKLVPIEPYDVTGEQIVARVIDGTPPGVHNRVMGLQNIKGPGLDFIYRFQAWDTCHNAAEGILNRNPQVAEKALQTLATFPIFGQLCHAKLRETLRTARDLPHLQRPEFQAVLDAVDTQLEQDETAIRATISDTGSTKQKEKQKTNPLGKVFLEIAEELLDVNDAARRREKADQIYADLQAERISRQRAVDELRKINKRQKGGWLAKK